MTEENRDLAAGRLGGFSPNRRKSPGDISRWRSGISRLGITTDSDTNSDTDSDTGQIDEGASHQSSGEQERLQRGRNLPPRDDSSQQASGMLEEPTCAIPNDPPPEQQEISRVQEGISRLQERISKLQALEILKFWEYGRAGWFSAAGIVLGSLLLIVLVHLSWSSSDGRALSSKIASAAKGSGQTVVVSRSRGPTDQENLEASVRDSTADKSIVEAREPPKNRTVNNTFKSGQIGRTVLGWARAISAKKPARSASLARRAASLEVDSPAEKPRLRYISCPPGFTFTGIVETPTGKLANINGTFVGVGDMFNGARLVEIKGFVVEMELENQRFLLGIGSKPMNQP